MNIESRREIVTHALRWAMNMVTEVVSNHGRVFPPEVRDAFRNLTVAMGEAERLSRTCVCHDPSPPRKPTTWGTHEKG